MSVTSLPMQLSAWFLKRNISRIRFFKRPHFTALLPLLLDILGNMYIVITCCSVCDMKFEINLTQFSAEQKCQSKNVNMPRMN